MSETDRDEKVAQAYRALGAEEPPRALDEAILAAARRRPARWRVPLSIAAVVVLAVGVTLRMLPQQPDAESVALAPQVIETPRPSAPPAETQAASAPSAAAVARAPERRAARNEPGAPAAVGALKKKDEAPAQVADARARDEALAARRAEKPAFAGAAAPPSTVAEAARRDEVMAGAKEQGVARAPAVAAPAGTAPAAAAPAAAASAATASAADTAAARALAAAKPAEPATPEAWLERIADLKKQGREREAEESLAEFKKRYPGYKIPEALTR